MDAGMLVPKGKEPEFNPSGRYVCHYYRCKEGFSVSWDRFAQHFICSDCGHVDGRRTKLFFDKIERKKK